MKTAILASIFENGSFSLDVVLTSLLAWLGIFAVTAIIVLVMVLLAKIGTKKDK